MEAYAWLVVNGFIHTEKFRQIFDWLVKAAAKQKCKLEVHTNAELLPRIVLGGQLSLPETLRRPDFVIFWDKDIRLARLLEKCGLRLFNSAKSIAICDDKAASFLELANLGISMPKTIIAPKTFRAEGYLEYGFLEDVESQLAYPFVIKECYGSFGQQVHLASNRKEAMACLEIIQNRPCLFQEFISVSKGHDVRLQMVGNQAVAAMYRYHESDFRANVTNGGNMRAYEPTEAQVQMAKKVMDALKLDFAGIDILFGEEGRPVLCEVNSNAHFINMFACTGINAADAIIRYCKGQAGC